MLIKPEKHEYPEFYDGYVQSVENENILNFLKEQSSEVTEVLYDVNEEKSYYNYAEGKWSIKEIMGHLNDAERILSYRALRFARRDTTDAAQYDHDQYVKTANFDSAPFEILLREFQVLREATIIMFNSFDDDLWGFTGYSGGKPFTLRSMPFIIAGHAKHHIEVVKERYL